MTEWPDQPRLEAALRRTGDEVVIDENHRRAVLAQLLKTEPKRSFWAKWARWLAGWCRVCLRRPALVAAAAGAAVVIGAVWLLTSPPAISTYAGQVDETTDPVPPPVEPRATEAASPSELTRKTLCQEWPAETTQLEFAVSSQVDETTDPVAIGVELGDGRLLRVGAATYIIEFGDDADWRRGRYLGVVDDGSTNVAFRVPAVSDVDQALSLVDTMVDATCTATTVVVVPLDVVPLGQRLSCRTVAETRTYAAVALIGADEPPQGCVGTVPTVVVGSGISARLSGWQTAYGCEGPLTEPLGDQVTVSTFDQCNHRLVVIDLNRPMADLWIDPELGALVIDRLLEGR